MRSPHDARWVSDCVADFIAIAVILALGVAAVVSVLRG